LRTEAEKAELAAQFRQAQKLEAVGRLTGGVAHDFNNLLDVISGYIDLMLMDLEEGHPLRKKALQIQGAVQKASSLIRQLMAFSRKQVLQPEVLNFNQVLVNLKKMLPRIIGEDIELAFALKKDLGNVKADPGQMEQVIMNLAVNARDAMTQGGKLTLETQNADFDEAYARRHAGVLPGPNVMLSVSDTGVGIARADLDKIFDPFFTTKEQGKGTGLGLSTVYGIVTQHGGHIRVYSEPGRGTSFKVYLPRVEDEMAESRRLGEDASPGGSEIILLVEDHEDVRELTQAMLQFLGYTVFTAATGEEALLLAEGRTDPLNLLFTDLVMPGINGRELAGRLGEIRPGIKVLFMSGYTDDAIVRHGALDKGANFIQKPFSLPTLAAKVRAVLGDPDDSQGGRP
jgi:two-component system, cell cycle sensor histidine kinase and response regulator CckA